MNFYSYFFTCPKYLEPLLAEELLLLGGEEVKPTLGGVHAKGNLTFAYRACLWSRIANRALLILKEGPVETTEDLYHLAQTISWQEHLTSNSTLYIDFQGESSQIRHTNFGAQKIKDAIVDQCRSEWGTRPSIDKDEPDLRVNVHLHRGQATISIDLSGDSLHRRSYRLIAGKAPLKENLAAAILMRARWPNLAKEGAPLIDPLCGSGTLLIEALLMAADIAPGLNRIYYGFLGWRQHDAVLWRSILDEAYTRKTQGLANLSSVFYGYDADKQAIMAAKEALKRLQLESYIKFSVLEFSDWHCSADLKPGLIITNPPYGERLSNVNSLVYFYQNLAEKIKQECVGWRLALLTGNPDLAKAMPLHAHKHYSLYNGAIECELLLFEIFSKQQRHGFEEKKQKALTENELSPGSIVVANRIKRNLRKLSAWQKREKVTCYRAYDADIPEYSAAIDKYHEVLHIQEYVPPKTIDPHKASQRLQEIVNAASYVFQIPLANIFVKERTRQKGAQQYQKLNAKGNFTEITEYDARLLVNFTDYLDTGIFLDHRPVRRLIRELASKKRFLNLFCYTGTATVQAAKGGAVCSVSVDLSPTYTQWARNNLALNGFSDEKHQVIQADCIQWLKENKSKFEVIMLDPPTFSNSKRTDTLLDIQEDHVELINLAMKALTKDGVLLFSTNFRRFKLDETALANYKIENITPKSFDPDFERDKRLHAVWLIRHG